MLKGKKSLFKRDPAPITTHTAQIVIEKYDLLQAWPIYAIHQSRTSNAHGVTLVANFHQSGFGPGDVVPVEAILRADVPGSGVILRAYELTVRETLIFRSSPPPVPQHHHHHLLHSQPQQPKRTPAAQTRSTIISDQKVPVPVQLFPGSQHRCDLGCQIPLAQTNVSVRTARHIEVNYVVQVKAVLANNAVLAVDLPVTITNWQRQASQDAVARIGYAPELTGGVPSPAPPGMVSPSIVSHPSSNPSLFQNPSPNPPNAPNGNGFPGNGPPMGNGPLLGSSPPNGPPTSAANSIPERVSRRSTATAESPGRNTIAAPPSNLVSRTSEIDELGYLPAQAQVPAQTMPTGRASNQSHANSNSQSGSGGRGGGTSERGDEPEGYFGNAAPLNSVPSAAVPRPRSASNRRSGGQQRFTVVNVDEPEGKHLSAEEEKRLLREKFANQDEQRRQRKSMEGGSSRPGARPSTAGSTNGGWMTAEDEKKRLFEQARQTAARTQQSAGHPGDVYTDEQPTSSGGASSAAAAAAVETSGAGGSSAAGGSGRKETSWPSAEEEKRRMFENARKAAAQTQQAAFSGPTPYADDHNAGGESGGGGFAGGWAFSSGGPMGAGTGSGGGGGSSDVPYGSPQPAEPAPYAQPEQKSPKPAAQQWLSAADEKRMLFEKARAAAEKTQMGAGLSGPPVDDGPVPSLHAPTPASNLTPTPYGGAHPRSNSAFSGAGQFVASPTTNDRPGFISPPVQTPAGGKSGEELFAAGLAAMGRQSMYSVPQSQTSQSPPPPQPQPPRVASPPYGGGGGASLGHSPSQRRFPSAAEEKAALAYMAAKHRVEQTWANEGGGGSSGGYANGDLSPHSPSVPSYDALYGNAPAPATSPLTRPLSVQRRTPSTTTGTPPPVPNSPPPMPGSDLPPGFTPNSGPTASALSALEEKARLRRQYEEQDAASGSASNIAPPSVTPPPPAQAAPPVGYGSSAQDEKERMRLMYAEQDAAVRTNERRATVDSGRRAALPAPPTASPPPPAVPGYTANGNANSSDPPPFMGGFINPATFKPLSAVEEKARLRAQYEAEANGHAVNGGGSTHEPPPPSFESHYQPQSPPQNSFVAPDRSTGPTPEPANNGGGLQRDPTISWGKRRATQTPAPPEEPLPRSAFVAPPPPPPLMPKPPSSYIQETIAFDVEAKDWDHSRSVTPDIYDDEPHNSTSPANAPPIPPKPSA
ncbi:hypothetical protein FRC07_001173 [Ceratobasidium sp. 392]|nr:hypothetical protein FRC07_001173 [Ceratobasidium sp. 392]